MELRKLWERRKNPTNLTHIGLRRFMRKHSITVGQHSYGVPRLRFPFYNTQLTIGDYCSIADGVEIFLGGNHRIDWVTTYPFGQRQGEWPEIPYKTCGQSRGNVHIGHDVWIGTHATIFSGVTVGNGAVIGARAVVTKDVPAYAIVAGNPARVIRMRFDNATISALETIAWWNWPREKVEQFAPLLMESPTAFIAAATGA